MATTKQLTGHTVSQLDKMSAADINELYDQLEDMNHHTACAIIACVKNERFANIRALELIDDLHMNLGHMPIELIQLRSRLAYVVL